MDEKSVLIPNSINEKLLFIVLLILCYFSFFLRLTSYPLLMWDESRFAVNAFELIKSKNFIVTSFNGLPDLWNTKPPLNVWVLAAFMKLFGYSELVIRLPSAIAALFTTVSVYHFVRKHLNDPVAAFFSGIVLLSSIGFISVHVARSADADAMVVLFMTLFSMKFYDSLTHSDNLIIHKKSFYFSLVFFSLALLTKSAYPLFLLPGLFVLVIILGKQKIFLHFPFYLAFIVSSIPFLFYCFLREHLNPGYLLATWQNDFGGRLSGTIENHSEPVLFYFIQLLNHRFFYWFYLVLVSTPFLLKGKIKQEVKLVQLCALSGFSVLLLISLSKTKLSYYDAAVFPFFSIIGGIALRKISILPLSRIKFKRKIFYPVYYLLTFLVFFFYPYRKIISYVNIKPGEAAALNLKYAPFMKKIYQGNENETVMFYDNAYNSHLIFYTNIYAEEGKNAKMITNINGLKQGELVATCNPELKKEIISRYPASLFKADKYCSCFRILK